MILNPGARIGRYEVRSLLGSGGMGEVYLAYDSELEREIAVKVLRDAESTDRARRFVQEARAASALHHPNVAHVYEIGSQDNVRFIAMEIIDGETLRSRMSRGEIPAAERFRSERKSRLLWLQRIGAASFIVMSNPRT